MSGQLGRRLRNAGGFSVLVLIGGLLGWKFGLWLWDIVLKFWVVKLSNLLAWPQLSRWLIAHRSGCRLFSGVAMSYYGFSQGAQTASRYEELALLKRRHQLTWYQLRHLNPVLFNPITDFVWSLSYTLAEAFLVPTGGLVCGALAYEYLSSESLIIAIIAGLLGLLLGWTVANMLVEMLFSRLDLTREIEEAALVIQAYGIAQEDERMAMQENRFWENNDGPSELPQRRSRR